MDARDRSLRGTWWVAAVVLQMMILASPAQAQFQSVRVQVIDRGQADGILIRTPNQRWVVIDAGQDRLQAEAMEDEWGVDSVALAVVSHRHIDHFGGMDDVLRSIPIGQFLMDMTDCPDRVHDDTIREIVDSVGIETLPVQPDTLDIDGVRFIILPRDPVADDCPDEENDNSILVRMEYGGFSMLFTGDAETDERGWLMENHPELLQASVLKASHHGSINGVDGEVGETSWMEVVDPERVVISAHLESRHGHPDPEAVEIYEDVVGHEAVYCTSRHGTLRIYGREDGRMAIYRQFPFEESCAFPGG